MLKLKREEKPGADTGELFFFLVFFNYKNFATPQR